ncbi:MAG: glycosyltransferase, partial [Cyanobacteria bacterium P01_A01_bin.83]
MVTITQQNNTEKVKIIDLEIDNISRQTLLENLKTGGVVFTPNVDHIIKLQSDREFYRAYQQADYV